MTVKSIISRTTLCPVVLKVYFLFAKKLATKAIDDEMILAMTCGTAKKFASTKSNPKSSAVFAAPTSPKRTLVACFLSSAFMIFLDEIERALFDFDKDSPDVFADNS